MNKMRALLFVDRKFTFHSGEYYTLGNLGLEIGSSYLPYVDELVIACRFIDYNDCDRSKLIKIESKKIKFCFLVNVSSPKLLVYNYFKLVNQIELTLPFFAFVIVRIPTEFGIVATNIASRNKHPKILCDLAGCAYDAMISMNTIVGFLYAIPFYLRCRLAVRKATHVAYVTKNFLQSRYPHSDTAITSSGTDLLLPKMIMRSINKFVDHSEGLKFATIGSLVGRFKGYHVAFAALSIFKKSFPKFEYHIFGGGDPTPHRLLVAKLGLEKNVIFHGFVSDKKIINQVLLSTDVYLQPSLREGMPRSIFEAMRFGLPILASDCAGIPEVIHSDYIHTVGDFVMLSKQLKNLIDADKRSIAAKSTRFAYQDYRVNILLQRRNIYKAFFDRLNF